MPRPQYASADAAGSTHADRQEAPRPGTGLAAADGVRRIAEDVTVKLHRGLDSLEGLGHKGLGHEGLCHEGLGHKGLEGLGHEEHTRVTP